MITKFLNVLAFSPVYPVYQMCILYIHLYNPMNPSIFAGSYCRAYHFDMVFHSNALTGVAISLQALILLFLHVSQNTSIHLLTFVESSICHLTQ